MTNLRKLEPVWAIENLDELMSSLKALYNRLLDQSRSVAQQWDGLKAAGGKCDEYAINLLGTLREPLESLATFANQAKEQIAQMETPE